MKTKNHHIRFMIPGKELLVTMLVFMGGMIMPSFAQPPVITVRFSNPTFDDCNHYCVGVEFLSDTDSVKMNAMNIRFFYPNDLLEFFDFMDLEDNYNAGSTMVSSSEPAGPALFNFSGGADFVNGSIFATDPETAMTLDTVVWTELFQACFTIDESYSDPLDFCPSIVWDLEQDPANGGFLPGDNGVVILVTINQDTITIPCTENVDQFNWEYIGDGSPPYGQPIQESCIDIDCPIVIYCAADTSVSCDIPITPDYTGYVTITNDCPGDTTVTYVDSIAAGVCTNTYTIYRKWEATNLCGDVDSCIQVIEVFDTTGPSMVCPPNLTVDCADQVPPVNLANVMATDLCPGNVIITFESEIITNQTCADQFVITRTFSATDVCGNSSTCMHTITVLDESGPFITCPSDLIVQCADLVPAPDLSGVSSWDYCGGSTTNAFVEDVISNQSCTNNFIINRTYMAMDECDNSSTCEQIISVIDDIYPTITTCAVTRNFEGCNTGVITDPPFSAISVASSEAVFENANNQGVASDPCGITSVTYEDLAVGICPIIVTRTWTITDACGNYSSCEQTINIEDTVDPIITTCAVNRMMDDCDLASITDPPYSPIEAASSEAEFENGINQGNVSDCNISTVTYIDDAFVSCPTIVTRTWTITDACGNYASCEQVITMCSNPSSANAGPDQQLCNETTTTLAAIAPLIGTGTWSVISGTADITDPSSPTSGVTGLVPGTSVTLEWTIVNGPCTENTDQMTITVDELPTIANAGFDRQTCDTLTNAIANTPIVGTGMWSVFSGTATLATPDLPTTNVTGLIPGTVTTLQWTITNGNCPPSTDQMTISVLTDPDAGPDQQLCNDTTTTLAANPITVGVGFWYVASGMATIADYEDPYTSVTLTPGVPTVLVWFIFFPPEGCDLQDSMTITWDATPGEADAGPDQVLCNQSNTTLDGNTPLTGTGSWAVISGTANITDPSSPNTEITGLLSGTSVVLEWTVTSGGCTPGSDEVTITIDELPTFADAGPTQFLCDEFSTTLAGNTPVVGTGLWTFNAGSATLSDPTSPVSGLTDLVPGTYVELHWTISNGSCPSSTDFVYIFDETPTFTNAGMDQQLCNATSTNLSADPLFCDDDNICETGYWTVISGTANITDPSSPTSEVTGLIPGTSVILEWTLGVENDYFCAGKDTVIISIDALPTTADAGVDQALCEQSSTYLAGNYPSVGLGQWSVVSGSVTITDPSYPDSEVINIAPGSSVTLAWTITNGVCPSSVDEMAITVDDLPTAADAGDDQELCDQTSTYLSANTPLIGTGLWTIISGSGMVTDSSSPTSEVTGLVDGTIVLEWRITNGVCGSTLDTVTLTIYANPDISLAGPDQQLCNQSNTILAANTPVYGSGLWSLVSGTANILDLSSPTSEVTGLKAGIPAVLQWTISNGTCPASIDQVTLLVDELPTPSNAGPDQSLCNQMTTSLSGNMPAIGTGFWTVINGPANITTPTSPTSDVTGLMPGTVVTLQWNITNGICPPSIDQVTITIDELPTPSNAGPDQSLCNQMTTSLSGNMPAIGTGFWTVINGPANITTPTSPTSGVTGLMPGTVVTLQWNITNGICPPSIDQVTITIDELPTPSNAGPDQSLCNQMTTSLSGNMPAIGTGFWTVINGPANITTPTSPTSGVTGLMPGTVVTLQWNITNGTCPPSIDQVSITIYALPTPANAGPDQSLCNETTTTLAGNMPAIGTGFWTVINGPANITTPTSPTSGVTGLMPGTVVTLQWNITNGICPPSIDQVSITIYALPTPANAGPDQSLCNQTTTTLAGNMPAIGTGFWTVINGLANITTPTSPTSGVTGLMPGTVVTLQWNITNGTCPPSIDQVTITVYALPTPANAGPDQSLCNQTTTTLSGNMPAIGTGFWTVITGPANITTPTSPTSGVTGLEPGTVVTLQWNITNGTCPPSMDQMKIRVYELPSPADAGPDQFLCDQSATVVNAEVPLIGNGTWTVIIGTATIFPDDQPNAAVFGLDNGTTTTLQWSVTNGTCPPSIDQLNITVNDFPTQSNAGPDQVVCQSTTTYLQGNEPEVGVGYWLKISGPGEITDPESPTSEITGLDPDTPTIAQWTIWNGFCQPSSDEVTIEVSEFYVQADAGPDQYICGESSVQLAGNIPLYGTGQWNIVDGIITINNLNDPNAEVTDFESGDTVVLEWTITNGDCPVSTDQMSIFTDVSTGLANAGPDLSFCADEMIMVEGNMPANGNGVWTIISGIAELINANQPSVQLQNFDPGTSIVLQWTVTNDGCLPDSDQVVINIDAAPTVAEAGLDFTLCETSSLQLSANTPLLGIGSWSVVSGNAMITDTSSPTSVLSGLEPGTTTVLEWSIGNGSCPLSVDQLSIQVDALPTVSDAGVDQVICDQTITMLEANTPLIGEGSWTILDGSATLIDSLSPSTPINNLQPGTTVTLQWTITNGICQESNDMMTIQVNNETSVALAGPDQVLCGDASTIIQANTPEFGQGQWSIVSGNAEITDSLSPITEVTALQPGTSVTLQWTISNGICASTSDELFIQINEAPSTADAGTDQAFCDQTESILNAVAPSIGTGQWDIISGSGILDDVSQPNTTVTGLDSESPLVLQWVTTFGNCQSHDTITLSTYESPTIANAGNDQTLCTTETTLNANTPLIGQGTWSIVSGAGSLADTSSSTTSISGLIPGELLVLQWTIANGVCPQSSDEVTIWVETETPVANAGDDQHLCEETITAIQAQPANVGTGTWTILSGSGTIQDSLAESTFVTDLLPGTTIIRWMVSGTACPPAHDDIVITIDAMPVLADAGSDRTICSSDLMLTALDPLIGTGAWTILSGIGSLQNQFDPVTLLTDLPGDTSIILEWKITNGICPSIADTITIITSSPSDTPDANDDQVLCNSDHAILAGNNPSPGGGTGTWSLLSGTGQIETINDSMAAVTGLGFGPNLFVWTISNGACASLSDTVVIQNNDHAELKSNFLVSEFACTDDSVHMFDISGNATLPTGFFWDFGDNTTSTDRDPIHVYTQQGDYNITLTTMLEGCGSVSTSKMIRVFNCLSTNHGNGGTRKVLYANVIPNPSDEDFKVSIKLREESEVIITLFDAVGRITETRKMINETDIKEIFHVEVPGLYFFHIQVGLEVMIFKVVKVEGSN